MYLAAVHTKASVITDLRLSVQRCTLLPCYTAKPAALMTQANECGWRDPTARIMRKDSE